MPGKYPTINSPNTGRAPITAGVVSPSSNSDKNTLSAMFPNSPIYSMTEADYRALAASYLQPATQTDTSSYPHFASPVNMDYQGTPDLSTPPTGFDSSYYPNLVVNPDPAGGEGSSVVAAGGTAVAANDNFGTGFKANEVNLAATAAALSTTSIDTVGPVATMGQSAAHSLNPGADGDPTT
jgi:hypothetical protein